MRMPHRREQANAVIALIFAASALFAQQTVEVVDVHGKVVDRLTNSPVVGARVIVARFDRREARIIGRAFETQPVIGEQDPKADRLAVLTGEDGSFRFSLESPVGFYLFVDAPGYVRPFQGIGPENTYEVKSGGSMREILVRVAPILSISGRIVDWDTGMPVRGLAVWAHQHRPAGSARALVVAGRSRSGEDGRFALERLAPGEYYLEARPPLGAKMGELTPAEDFLGAVLKGYVPSWYPGVGRVEEAVPVELWEGAAAQEVKMRIRKTEIARIRGRVLGGAEEAENSEVSLALVRVENTPVGRAQRFIARGKVRLNSEFQIDGVPPGRYWLAASAPGPARADRQSALLAIDVAGKNQQGLDLLLSKGISVNGTVRIKGIDQYRDKHALPVDNMRLLLRPLLRVLPDSDPLVTPVRSSDGSFTIEGVFPDKYHVRVLGAPAGYAVAELRYNGSAVHHGLLSFREAREHKLEITLAPADASVLVSATDGLSPAAGATIVLVQEPVTDDLFLLGGLAYRKVNADQDGKAMISKLLPGRYRLSAYAASVLWAEIPRLEQQLASGVPVIVGATQTAMVEVRVSDEQ